jgi:hypothetical protein
VILGKQEGIDDPEISVPKKLLLSEIASLTRRKQR